MNAWLSLSEFQPTEPGLYWCCSVSREKTGNMTTVHYHDKAWHHWDGCKWDGEGFTHFYSEKPKGEK